MLKLSWIAEEWILAQWSEPPYYGIMHTCGVSFRCPDILQGGEHPFPLGATTCQYPHIPGDVRIGNLYIGEEDVKAYCVYNKCGEEIPKALVFLVGMMEAGKKL